MLVTGVLAAVFEAGEPDGELPVSLSPGDADGGGRLHGDHLGSASWRRIGAVTALTERTFTGQALDSRTGLMYYRARWYDPRLGRFIQADTVVPGAGNPQALNRYAYVVNNPLRYTDPSGHYTDDEIQQYLKNMYGEKWGAYWTAWSSDDVFMEMLHLADDGDALFAPSVSWLGAGVFGSASGAFSFLSDQELTQFQGYGPYLLLDDNGQVKIDGAASVEAHPIDFDSKRDDVLVQPLYQYTDDGPQYTGLYRQVSYSRSGYHIDALAGDSVPGIVGVGYSLVELAAEDALCPVCGPVILAVSAVTWVNNLVVLDYSLREEILDTRTFIEPADPCLYSPCWYAAP